MAGYKLVPYSIGNICALFVPWGTGNTKWHWTDDRKKSSLCVWIAPSTQQQQNQTKITMVYQLSAALPPKRIPYWAWFKFGESQGKFSCWHHLFFILSNNWLCYHNIHAFKLTIVLVSFLCYVHTCFAHQETDNSQALSFLLGFVHPTCLGPHQSLKVVFFQRYQQHLAIRLLKNDTALRKALENQFLLFHLL